MRHAVLGLSRGAVPEIVEHGVTGFVADDVDGLVAAVRRLHEINALHAACALSAFFLMRPWSMLISLSIQRCSLPANAVGLPPVRWRVSA